MKIILLIVIVLVPVAELKIVKYCPDQQVPHFDPDTKVAFCCISVPLPKGYEFIRCHINGTQDSTRKCPEGLVQEDETTTESEATCTAEMQCIAQENQKMSQCDQRGENCIHKCVCNYTGGFCGTAYYDCRPFPQDCDKEHVQENCSCNTPRVNGSGTDTTNMPSSTVTSLNLTYVTKPVNGNNETNTTNGTFPTVTDKNDSTSRPVLKEEDKSGFPVYLVIGTVIAAIFLVVVLVILVCFHESLRKKLLCMFKRCQKSGQNTDYDEVPQIIPPIVVIPIERPIAAVRPFVQPGRDQSFNVHAESEDERALMDVFSALPDQPVGDVIEEPHVPYQGLSDHVGTGRSIEGWHTLSTIASTSVDHDNTSAKQIESEQNNDNTIVKQVVDAAPRREKEVEENYSGNSGVPIVDPRFQSVSSEWSSFSGGSYNSTSGQFVDNPHEDFNIQEQENL